MSKKNRTRMPSQIGPAIASVLMEPQFAECRKSADLKKIWKEVAGDFIASNTSVNDFKNGVITIFTKASAFAFQLKSLKAGYISAMNAKCPGLSITEIYFKVGRVTEDVRKKTHVEEIIERAREEELAHYNIENIEIPADVEAAIKDFVNTLNISDEKLLEKTLEITRNIYKVSQYKKRNGFIECKICDFLHEAAKNSDGLCDYCKTRMEKTLSACRARIIEKPHESYEKFSEFYPDIKYREFNFVKQLEIERIKKDLAGLIEKYIREETREIFTMVEKSVRTAMSLSENENYFEVSEFGEKKLQRIADVLGPNARTVFAKGMFLSKIF